MDVPFENNFVATGDPRQLRLTVSWACGDHEHRGLVDLSKVLEDAFHRHPRALDGEPLTEEEAYAAATDALGRLFKSTIADQWNGRLLAGEDAQKARNQIRARAKLIFPSAFLALSPDFEQRFDGAMFLRPVIGAFELDPLGAIAALEGEALGDDKTGTGHLVLDAPGSLLALAVAQHAGTKIWNTLTRKLCPDGVPARDRQTIRSSDYATVLAAWLRLPEELVARRAIALGVMLRQFADGCFLSTHHVSSWLLRWIATAESDTPKWIDLIDGENPWHRLFAVLTNLRLLDTNAATFTPEWICYFRTELGLITPEDFWVACLVRGVRPYAINDGGFRMSQMAALQAVKRRTFLHRRHVNYLFLEQMQQILDDPVTLEATLLEVINQRRREQHKPTFACLADALEDSESDHRKRLEDTRERIQKRATQPQKFALVFAQFYRRHAALVAGGAVYSLLDRAGRLRLAMRAGLPGKRLP